MIVVAAAKIHLRRIERQLKRAIATTQLHIIACRVRRSERYTDDALSWRETHDTQTMRWIDAKQTLCRWRKRWAEAQRVANIDRAIMRTKTGVIMTSVTVMVIGKKTSADWHYSDMTIPEAVRGIQTSWQRLLVGIVWDHWFRHTVMNSDMGQYLEQPRLAGKFIGSPMQTTDLIF